MHLAGMREGWGGRVTGFGFCWNFVAGLSCRLAILLSSFGAVVQEEIFLDVMMRHHQIVH